MSKKAIFFDLDNTIYPVASIGDKLFEPLINLITQSEEFSDDKQLLKELLRRKPFHYVADHYGLSNSLKEKSVKVLQQLTCEVPIKTFPGYEKIRELPQKKFLITAGFTKLQLSKLRQLGIENDFDGVYIIDQSLSNDTKKSKFAEIMADNNLNPEDILVIGDDPASEIQAAKELGIDAVLFDSLNLHKDLTDINKLQALDHLISFV